METESLDKLKISSADFKNTTSSSIEELRLLANYALMNISPEMVSSVYRNRLRKRAKADRSKRELPYVFTDEMLAMYKVNEPFETSDGNHEAAKIFNSGGTLHWSLNQAGFGDFFFIAPLIFDTLKVRESLNINGRTNVFLRPEMLNMGESIFEDLESVSVMGLDRGLDVMESGLILGESLIFDWRYKSPETTSSLIQRIYLADEGRFKEDTNEYDVSSSITRALQSNLSSNIGIKLFDTNFRDNLAPLINGLNRYRLDWLLKNGDKHRSNFYKNNDYICLVPQGSYQSKEMHPSFIEKLLKHIKPYMDNRNLSLNVLCDTEYAEKVDILGKLNKTGVSGSIYPLDQEFGYAFNLIYGSIGLIGVDTFLTHFSELLNPRIPTLNFYSTANPNKYRLLGENIDTHVVHSATHPLVDAARDFGISYFRKIMEIYMNEYSHPFDISISERSNIASSLQIEFKNRAEDALNRFFASIS